MSDGQLLALVRVCLLVLLLSSAHGHANLVQWELQGVVFDDGGSANGFVTFNFGENYPDRVDNPILYDVQTFGGQAAPTRYNGATADALLRFGGFGVEEILLCNPFEATFQHQCLHLVLNEILPSQGGTVELAVCKPITPMDCPGVEETGAFGDVLRHATSGTIVGTVVPEVSPAGFIAALAFGAMVMLRRRCSFRE